MSMRAGLALPGGAEETPPDTQRTYSSVYSNKKSGVGHRQGRLDSSQGWSSAKGTKKGEEWLQMDAGKAIVVSGILVQPENRVQSRQVVTEYTVKTSDDGVKWVDVGVIAGEAPGTTGAKSSSSDGRLVFTSGMVVTIKGGNSNEYLSDRGDKVACNGGHGYAWEKFTIVAASGEGGNRTLVMKGGKSNQFCSDRGDKVQCNVDQAASWEKFTFEITPGTNEVMFRGGRSNKYCSGTGSNLVCDRDIAGPWEKFEVKPV